MYMHNIMCTDITNKGNLFFKTLYCGLLLFYKICTLVHLRYSDPEDRFFFFNHVISIISTALRETTLTIPDSSCEPFSMKSEVVRVVSLSTTELSQLTRLKVCSSG